MGARALGIALALVTAVACSSSGPVDDQNQKASLAQRVAGRWTLVSDAPLSAMVTGFDVTVRGDRLDGSIFLSGRVLPATGQLTTDGFTLAPAESGALTIRARLRPDAAIDATVTVPGRAAVQSRFVRAAESR